MEPRPFEKCIDLRLGWNPGPLELCFDVLYPLSYRDSTAPPTHSTSLSSILEAINIYSKALVHQHTLSEFTCGLPVICYRNRMHFYNAVSSKKKNNFQNFLLLVSQFVPTGQPWTYSKCFWFCQYLCQLLYRVRCLNEDKEQILTDHEDAVNQLHYMDKSMLTGSDVRLLECIYTESHHVLSVYILSSWTKALVTSNIGKCASRLEYFTFSSL